MLVVPSPYTHHVVMCRHHTHIMLVVPSPYTHYVGDQNVFYLLFCTIFVQEAKEEGRVSVGRSSWQQVRLQLLVLPASRGPYSRPCGRQVGPGSVGARGLLPVEVVECYERPLHTDYINCVCWSFNLHQLQWYEAVCVSQAEHFLL